MLIHPWSHLSMTKRKNQTPAAEMKINKVRIKNYRSIKSEIIVDFNAYLTILGPNNSGKTNFLKAVCLFFEAARRNTYSIEHDLPFGISGAQTSIAISFSATRVSDNVIMEKYHAITDLLEGEKDLGGTTISLYLSFSPIGNPIYRFFTNDKVKVNRKDDYRRMQDELVYSFLDSFSCKYVPSEKSAEKLFDDFLLPHLREYIGDILKDQNEKVTKALGLVSASIATSLATAGLSDISCEFALPGNSFSNALSKFDFFINDGEKTQYYRKGSGIQAATTLACFKWVAERELQKKKNVIWLIEEPESYLHPALTDSCRKIIHDLSEVSDVFATTHAIGFIPADHERALQTSHSSEQGTSFNKFKGYADATESIRSALGVRFSDYYHLTEFNIFVEGKTDKLIIEHLLSVIKPKGVANKFETLRAAAIMDFTGTSSLKDFLKSTYALMSRERSIVVIFDGDDAGLKATKELNGYFGNKRIQFSSNQEYIILPKRAPIEALFPQAWLEQLAGEHPTWAKLERDGMDEVVDFNMQGDRKMEIANWLIAKSKVVTAESGGTYTWAADFIKIFKKIDEMLIAKHQYLKNGSIVKNARASLEVSKDGLLPATNPSNLSGRPIFPASVLFNP